MFETKNLLVGLLIGALVLAWGAERIQRFEAERDLSSKNARIEKDRADSQANARTEEARREDEKEKGIQDAIAKTAAAKQFEVDRANGIANGLRKKLAAYSAPGNSTNPDIASGSEAQDPRVGVLADLFARADERAGILAKEADALRISGQACQRLYESLGQ